MKITERQQLILEELRKIGRDNFYRYKDTRTYLHSEDCKQLARGDEASAFGLGGLTFQVGNRLGIKVDAVLSTFKALERKGLVVRETRNPSYQRPLYWWPVGLAKELHDEITNSGDEVCDG